MKACSTKVICAGYGGSVDVLTIDVISTERNVIGNLVGSYNDLVELMVLAADGRVEMLTQTYPLEAVNDAMDDLDAGRLRGRDLPLFRRPGRQLGRFRPRDHDTGGPVLPCRGYPLLGLPHSSQTPAEFSP